MHYIQYYYDEDIKLNFTMAILEETIVKNNAID